MTCALTGGGAVKCWGSGLLGDGSRGSSSWPVDVVGLTSGVTAIAVHSNHSCAITAGGGVKCWGNNAYGELGDGTTINRYTPVDVVSLGGEAVSIS